MRLLKGVLTGLAAACLARAAAAQDTPSPENRVAPLEYLRICDASGAAFFVRPGTDTCLSLAGASQPPQHRFGPYEVSGGASFQAPNASPFFDFDDARNCENSCGADATVGLLAYTATFGAGFSTSMSFEAHASRRGAMLGTIASAPEADPISINGISAPSFRGGAGGSEVSEIVGNVRRSRNWGTVRLDPAALRLSVGLFANQAVTSPSPAYPVPALPSNSYGLALQGGAQPNMDYLSPGDRLWLQAAYENSAYGSVSGGTIGSTSNLVDPDRFGRFILAPVDSVYAWRQQASTECIWTGSLTCERGGPRESSPDARSPYRLPTFSSAIFGPSQDVSYSPAAIAGFGGPDAIATIKEARIGPSFIGMPITGFDIGAEFMYINVKQARPSGVATSPEPSTSPASGVPAVKSNQSEYQGRLRVQRAF